jgi:hypothetical protein
MKYVALATPNLLAFDAVGKSHCAGAPLPCWKAPLVVSSSLLDMSHREMFGRQLRRGIRILKLALRALFT